MSQLGTVRYSEAAYKHMREHAELVFAAKGEIERILLLKEAATIHAFHEEFPGVVMHEADGG